MTTESDDLDRFVRAYADEERRKAATRIEKRKLDREKRRSERAYGKVLRHAWRPAMVRASDTRSPASGEAKGGASPDGTDSPPF